ncbi:DUF5954 family protein [Streptomyces sp. NPDC053429]|uniref:DUF5954 family protein n=1 Tax=Streptomyces sp. NPDC053429 TaxID=3365702 RepID=UPI0037D7AA28
MRRAKDDAGDRAERRALLAAVARLETERVDRLDVAGSRYRVVCAEEYGGSGPDGAGERFPDEVREDSLRALETHADVLLLPATFEVVERTAKGWKAVSGPYATAHEARRSLDFALRWAWPRMHGLIPLDADPSADARTFAEGGAAAGAVAAEPAGYAGAADALRAAGRVNRLQFRDTVHQIVRTRRLLR